MKSEAAWFAPTDRHQMRFYFNLFSFIPRKRFSSILVFNKRSLAKKRQMVQIFQQSVHDEVQLAVCCESSEVYQDDAIFGKYWKSCLIWDYFPFN